jgi:hypothetical protein
LLDVMEKVVDESVVVVYVEITEQGIYSEEMKVFQQ